jgi:hypothetical protein
VVNRIGPHQFGRSICSGLISVFDQRFALSRAS